MTEKIYLPNGDVIESVSKSAIQSAVHDSTQEVVADTISTASAGMRIKLSDVNYPSMVIYRGQTFSQSLYINNGTLINPSRYVLQTGDELVVGLMTANQKMFGEGCEAPLVIKTLTKSDIPVGDNDALFTLTSEETSELPTGIYYLQIFGDFTTSSGYDNVQVLLPRTQLRVLD